MVREGLTEKVTFEEISESNENIQNRSIISREIKLPTSIGSSKKHLSSKKKNICFIDYTKALIVWITTNCGKF